MSSDLTHWIFPISDDSPFFLDLTTGQQNVLSPEALMQQIEQRPDQTDRRAIRYGHGDAHPVHAGDAIWIYAGGGPKEICALAWAMDTAQRDPGPGRAGYVDLQWDIPATRELMANPIPWSRCPQDFPTHECFANPATTAVLQRWLETSRPNEPSWNDPRGPDFAGDERSRKLVNSVVREGQERFRTKLLRHYHNQCAILQKKTVDVVLEAAHITRYMGLYSNVLNNGLLLRIDLHKLLDAHQIGVDADGKLVVSMALTGTSYADLHRTKLYEPEAEHARPSAQRLKDHLALVKANPVLPS